MASRGIAMAAPGSARLPLAPPLPGATAAAARRPRASARHGERERHTHSARPVPKVCAEEGEEAAFPLVLLGVVEGSTQRQNPGASGKRWCANSAVSSTGFFINVNRVPPKPHRASALTALGLSSLKAAFCGSATCEVREQPGGHPLEYLIFSLRAHGPVPTCPVASHSCLLERVPQLQALRAQGPVPCPLYGLDSM